MENAALFYSAPLPTMSGARSRAVVRTAFVGISGSGKRRFVCPALRAGWDVTHSPILRPRNWGPRKSPAKRVLWGEDEQGSERNFCRQAEMEWSGLCEDEGVLRGQIIRAWPLPA